MLTGRGDEPAALVEIDPDSGAELSSETFQLEWSSSLLPAGDAVWTLAREVREGAVQGGYLHQLAPGDAPDVSTGGSFALPVTDGEWIWSTASGDDVAMNLSSGIAQIDPADGSVVEAWETGVVGYDIAVGPDRGVWFFGRRGLERLNPSSGHVQTWRSGGEDDAPTFIVPVRHGVWLGMFGGVLEFRPFKSDGSTAVAGALTVPDVVGQNFLSALGWVDPPFSLLESEYRDAAGYENGTILEQDPAPGTQVDASETEIVIHVVVSVAPSERLRGTEWRLRVMDGRTWPIGGAPDVTIEFKAHRVQGFSGCNEYSTPYEMDGRRLIVGPITATLIGCSGERDWVQGRLFKILEADPVATARGDGLRLVAAPEGVADFAAS